MEKDDGEEGTWTGSKEGTKAESEDGAENDKFLKFFFSSFFCKF